MAKRSNGPGERISEAERLWKCCGIAARSPPPRSATRSAPARLVDPDGQDAARRLVQKQAVGTEPEGRKFLYRPLIARSDYVGRESRRLVDRLFGGRAAPLFAQLARR